MILDRLDLDAVAFQTATGWQIKPEGACKGDVCVPLAGEFDLAATADRLGMATVHDEVHGLWAVGPESLSAHALVTAQAPDLVLDDIDGNEFHLSSLRWCWSPGPRIEAVDSTCPCGRHSAMSSTPSASRSSPSRSN